MGLDVSHDCYSGGYSSFNVWRSIVAAVAGIPLYLMEGFYNPARYGDDPLKPDDTDTYCIRESLPIQWDILKPDPLLYLLDHSDCDGEIPHVDCKPLADRLAELLPQLEERQKAKHIQGMGRDWVAITKKWIEGLNFAHERGEDVQFG